jgi:hypothetical protein
MDEVTYGFYASNIARLAGSLSKILQIHLYSHQSPMDGPWYSSHDLDSLSQAVKQALEQNDFEAIAEINRTAEVQPLFEIVLNDPDPYYCPKFPEKVHCVLRFKESLEGLSESEDKLRASGLNYIELKRKQAEK